jgi:hypothetical protein
VIPETLTPGPVTLTLETVSCDSPELVSRIVWVVALPVGTVPKATLDGVAVRAELAEVVEVPVPLHPIASEASDAVLLMVSAPEAFPAAAGLNTAVRFALAPAGKVVGVESPETEMPEPETDMAEIVILDEPEFFS